jgi:hypothetical protein
LHTSILDGYRQESVDLDCPHDVARLKNMAAAYFGSIGINLASKQLHKGKVALMALARRLAKINYRHEVAKFNQTYANHAREKVMLEVQDTVKGLMLKANQLMVMGNVNHFGDPNRQEKIRAAFLVCFFLLPCSTSYSKEDFANLFGCAELYKSYPGLLNAAKKYQDLEDEAYRSMAATMTKRTVVSRQCTIEEQQAVPIRHLFTAQRDKCFDMANFSLALATACSTQNILNAKRHELAYQDSRLGKRSTITDETMDESNSGYGQSQKTSRITSSTK